MSSRRRADGLRRCRRWRACLQSMAFSRFRMRLWSLGRVALNLTRTRARSVVLGPLMSGNSPFGGVSYVSWSHAPPSSRVAERWQQPRRSGSGRHGEPPRDPGEASTLVIAKLSRWPCSIEVTKSSSDCSSCSVLGCSPRWTVASIRLSGVDPHSAGRRRRRTCPARLCRHRAPSPRVSRASVHGYLSSHEADEGSPRQPASAGLGSEPMLTDPVVILGVASEGVLHALTVLAEQPCSERGPRGSFTAVLIKRLLDRALA